MVSASPSPNNFSKGSPLEDGAIGSSRGVYGISVAAELVGNTPQNLRLYEARGLLDPARSAGGTRRYSADNLDRLREINRLLDAGLNLAGIAAVLELQATNRVLRAELAHSRQAPKSRARKEK